MMKRTLIAIAVVALLTTTVSAAISDPWLGHVDKNRIVKVDGKDTPTIRWPYSINYTAITICTIPVYMEVGMYVEIEKCDEKKVVLKQVECGTIGKGSGDFPCYYGDVSFNARANFPAKFGVDREKVGDTIKDWSAGYDGGDTIDGDGNWHGLKIVVKAWKTQIWKAQPGDQVEVGKLHVTVKPNV